MSLLEIGLMMLFVFIMVYALVDRVCKCLETRAMAKAFFASAGKGMMGNPAEAIAKLNAALNSKSKDA